MEEITKREITAQVTDAKHHVATALDLLDRYKNGKPYSQTLYDLLMLLVASQKSIQTFLEELRTL